MNKEKINKLLSNNEILLPITLRHVIVKEISNETILSTKASPIKALHNRSVSVDTFYRPISKIAYDENTASLIDAVKNG